MSPLENIGLASLVLAIFIFTGICILTLIKATYFFVTCRNDAVESADRTFQEIPPTLLPTADLV